MCVCVCVLVPSAIKYMWKSENTFGESALFLHYGFQRSNSGHQPYMANTFSLWAIPPVLHADSKSLQADSQNKPFQLYHLLLTSKHITIKP